MRRQPIEHVPNGVKHDIGLCGKHPCAIVRIPQRGRKGHTGAARSARIGKGIAHHQDFLRPRPAVADDPFDSFGRRLMLHNIVSRHHNIEEVHQVECLEGNACCAVSLAGEERNGDASLLQ